MPIASAKPSEKAPITPDLPQVEPKDYKSIIYDTNNVPLHSLIAYIEGSPSTGTYYRQLVTKHNDLQDVDIEQMSMYQQYLKVNGLEMRVDQALSTSYDSGNAITRTTGTAVMYPFMQPNAGDIFITDAGNNRKVILRITNVNRLTHNRDSAYGVEYTLYDYVDRKPEVMATLETKTVKEYFFSKQRLLEGLQPFIKSEEYENVSNIQYVLADVTKYYFRNIFNPRFSTLVVPGQEKDIYDSNMVKYLMQLVRTEDAPEVRRVRTLPTDNDPYLSQPDFWSMLFDRDYAGLKQVNDEMGLASAAFFNTNTYLTGFRYMGVDFLVYPRDPDVSLKLKRDQCSRMLVELEDIYETTSFKKQDYTDIENTYSDGVNVFDIIHEVLVDRKYVLSEAFYNGTDQQSLLEILVKDYITRQFIDLKKLYACCHVVTKWKRLEQYYYGPILITLLLEANRAQYT